MHRSTVALIAIVALLVGAALATYSPLTRTGEDPRLAPAPRSYSAPSSQDKSCITYDGDFTNDVCP